VAPFALLIRSSNWLYSHNYNLSSGGPWYSTTSLGNPNAWKIAVLSAGLPAGFLPRPHSPMAQTTVVLLFPLCWHSVPEGNFLLFYGASRRVCVLPWFRFYLVFPYVCGGRYCFILLSSEKLFSGRICSGFERFDFSHESVKQVVGLLIGFVIAIASAA